MSPRKPTVKAVTYVWEGTNKRAEPVKGEINSSNLILAKMELRRQGIHATKIRKKSRMLFSIRKKIKSKDITLFTRQMATMLQTGIPIIQSFDLIGRGQTNPSMQTLIFQIKKDIEGGSTLREALSKHPAYFNDLFCSLVGAGEQAGALDTMLTRLALHKEKTESMRAKIKKAMFYPMAVMTVLALVTTVLLVFVVPQFETLFKDFGANLPALTQIVINLSRFFQADGWLIFVGFALSMMGIVQGRKKIPAVAYFIDRNIFRLPVLGMVLRKAAIARFTRTLSTTFAAGLPLVDALKSASGTAGNLIYRDAILKIRDDVSTGQQLQQSLQSTGLFPAMVIQMVSIGEESGALEKMLSKVAEFYEEEVDNTVDGLSSLLEPLIIVILGVVVGTLVVAMYLPIFKLGSVVH